MNADVPRDTALGPFLYLIYTKDFPESSDFTCTIFDDIEVMATD